jgi:hypothetical protein
MYSFNDLDSHQFPPTFRIYNQAKFLAKRLPVTLSQAKEIISFYYDCKNWKDLMHFASTSTAPSNLFKEYDNAEIVVYREKLANLIESNWDANLIAVKELSLIPYTVSHCLSSKNLKALLDEEIVSLYYHIFEGETEPQYNIYDALAFADNSILTHIRHKSSGPNRRGHMTDHRFGFTFYYNFEIQGDSIRLVIRELDTLFGPSVREHFYNSLFKKAWFINYTYGYLQHLIKCLQKEFNSGKVVLHRVFNHDCIITDCSPHQENPCHMKELGAYLVQQGGTVEHVICEADPRMGVALAFNSN